MALPYVGEIRMFAGNFAPAGWAYCDGSLVAITQNETLFNLIGTTYGGDGQSTFALPDLRGRVPIHQGNSFTLAQTGGVESVTLNVNQLPVHSHVPSSSITSGSDSPSGNVWGKSTTGKPYGVPPASAALNAQSVSASGGSQPHENMHPFLTISYIISLFGIFPSQG